jgi:predicted TPR repeat methyltransferase
MSDGLTTTLQTADIRARETELTRAHLLNPENPDALLALGDFLVAQSRDRDAAGVFRQLLDRDPNHAAATLKLGNILHEYPAFRNEAIELLYRAISLDRSQTAAYRPLASTLNECGRRDDAISVLRDWCAVDPEAAAAKHLLAAYSEQGVPTRAADAFVRQTFDSAAERFDEHLRTTLQYRAPEVLSAHLAACWSNMSHGTLRALDMGCGTGLCVPMLRPWAKHLTGVDLSAGMLAKANLTGGYDALEEAELTEYLENAVEKKLTFDLLFAADTFVYFGQLDRLLTLSFEVLGPGGWLAFTVERLSPSDNGSSNNLLLDVTGRYKHSEPYVRDALDLAGFSSPQIAESPVRMESGVPTIALVVAAQRPH